MPPIDRRNILLLMMVIFISFVLLEGALRLGYYFIPQPGYPYPDGMFVSGENMGYQLSSNFSGIMNGNTNEFQTIVHTDQFGFRLNNSYPSDVTLLGDSNFFGWGVEENQTILYYLQTMWSSKNVSSLSVPGYGTTEYLSVLKENSILVSNNSVVILGATVFNDVTDNGFKGYQRTVVNQRLKQLAYNPFNLNLPLHIFLSSHSKIYIFTCNKLFTIFKQKDLISQNSKTLQLISEELENKDSQLIILLIYNKDQLHLYNIQILNSYLQFCLENRLLCIDINDAFPEGQQNFTFQHDPHFNAQGTKRIAELLAQKILVLNTTVQKQ